VKFNDALSGGFFIVLAAAIFYLTREFRIMPGQNYGAAFFPRTIATAMCFFGMVLVARRVMSSSSEPWLELQDWLRSPRHIASFALVVAALVFYILASGTLGFLLTGFMCLVVLLLWLRGAGRWLEAVAISLVCVLAIQFFFGKLLRVPLPWGLLEPVAW
jgi:putative tricarboxylic transport membrane protein